MKNMFKRNKVTLALAVVVSVFFVATTVSAVTTISTAISTAGNITTTAGNIEATAGTLTIGGTSTLTGNTAITGTLSVTGLTTLVNASTTRLSVGGSNGTTMTQILKGTCNLSVSKVATALSTSTLPHHCSVTNVASGDQVFVSLASDGGSVNGPANIGGIRVTYAIASSTAGIIEVGLSNMSGAATSSYPLATTSVQYLIVR